MDWFSLGGIIGVLILGVYNGIQNRLTHRAVQPNGETLHDILVRMEESNKYQHSRNHDIIKEQMRTEAAMILALCGYRTHNVQEAEAAVKELAEKFRLERFPEWPMGDPADPSS